IKYLPAFIVLLFLLHYLRRSAAEGRLPRAIAGVGLVTSAVLLAAYLPFRTGVDDPRQLLAAASFNAMPNSLHRAAVATIQTVRAHCGLSGIGISSDTVASTFTAAGFASLLVVAMMRASSPDARFADLPAPFALLSFVYVYVVFGASFPWYMITPLAALA